jgi:hypothetical protein
METVKKMAEEVEWGLKEALPKLRKTIVMKLALAVGAIIEERTQNMTELAQVLSLATDMREQ